MLITVFLMSTVLLSILTLMITIVLATAKHRGTVRATNEATSVSERIDHEEYQRCGQPSPVDYDSAIGTLPTGYVAQVLSIEYLESSDADTSSFQATCPAAGDQGVQRILVEVTAQIKPSSKATIELMKRDRVCPAGLGSQVAVNEPC
ncbi:MAG: hypothetical protein ACK5O2_16560 [Microthrixaceae bacterium]